MTDASPEPTDPRAYRHWVDDVIRFSDQDPGGHVNNTAYAAYVEHGRVATMRSLGFQRMAGARFVLAHLEIDFRSEAHFPGALRIGTRAIRVGSSSITLGHAVFQDDRCLATAQSVLVHMAGATPAPLPEEARRAVAAMG